MAKMLVGYFSYDIIRYIEKIPNKCIDDLKIPDVRLMRPRNLIIYDNQKKYYFSLKIYLKIKKLLITLSIMKKLEKTFKNLKIIQN